MKEYASFIGLNYLNSGSFASHTMTCTVHCTHTRKHLTGSDNIVLLYVLHKFLVISRFHLMKQINCLFVVYFWLQILALHLTLTLRYSKDSPKNHQTESQLENVLCHRQTLRWNTQNSPWYCYGERQRLKTMIDKDHLYKLQLVCVCDTPNFCNTRCTSNIGH